MASHCAISMYGRKTEAIKQPPIVPLCHYPIDSTWIVHSNLHILHMYVL